MSSTKYVKAQADKIIELIASGKTLADICRGKGMPARTTFLAWVTKDRGGLADRYARARAMQLDCWADDIIQLADTTKLGKIVTDGPDGKTTKTQDMTEHRRLQIESRKWMLARLAAHKYGDRAKVEVEGKIGLAEMVAASYPKKSNDEPEAGG